MLLREREREILLMSVHIHFASLCLGGRRETPILSQWEDRATRRRKTTRDTNENTKPNEKTLTTKPTPRFFRSRESKRERERERSKNVLFWIHSSACVCFLFFYSEETEAPFPLFFHKKQKDKGGLVNPLFADKKLKISLSSLFLFWAAKLWAFFFVKNSKRE